MKGSVLIVEDVPEMALLIELYLKKEGYETVIAGSGEKALLELHNRSFDLMVLDLNLPGMDGFQCLQTVREDFAFPILIVSARDDDEDIIKGLNLGADDYVPKPFSPRVLVARVNAVLRRDKNSEISFGPYTFNAENYLLKRDNERILLSGKEFDILALLIEHQGKPLTSEDIFQKIWGDIVGEVTTVAVHIQRLRKKIEADPAHPVYIKTIHGKGYCFGWNL